MLVICTCFTFTASSIFIRAEKTGSHFLFSLNELDDLYYIGYHVYQFLVLGLLAILGWASVRLSSFIFFFLIRNLIILKKKFNGLK